MSNVKQFTGHSTPPDLWNLVDLEEAARLLHIKPGTHRQWNCRRKLPFYKVGNKAFYAKSDIAAYLNTQRVDS